MWPVQINAQTDPTGKRNIAYPETNAFDWYQPFTGNPGTEFTIRGQYPAARYMSLELYDVNMNVIGSINGAQINPDAGQNNPFRSGSVQGTYTVNVLFGRPGANPEPNAIYTNGKNFSSLVYRIYYPSNPTSVTGGATNPALPVVHFLGVPLTSCAPRPIITPATATVWGRLATIDFVGTKPAQAVPATNPPSWTLVSTNSNTPYYPSADNSYLIAMLSRDYLNAPYNYDLVVLRFLAPTFPDTQAGVPASTPAQVRYWSVCTDDNISTAVIRCAADDQSPQINGYVTYVISDPSKQPSPSVLSQWGAAWIAWGALEPSDVLYGPGGQVLTNANGVLYYNPLIYRQTQANPLWPQSIYNVTKLPPPMQQKAMGAYWPTIGYCTLSQFNALGVGCIGH